MSGATFSFEEHQLRREALAGLRRGSIVRGSAVEVFAAIGDPRQTEIRGAVSRVGFLRYERANGWRVTEQSCRSCQCISKRA